MKHYSCCWNRILIQQVLVTQSQSLLIVRLQHSPKSQTLTNKTLTSPTINSPTITSLTATALSLTDSSIVFEGSTVDANETTLTVVDPTDRTITLPNETGTLITSTSAATNAFSISIGNVRINV